MNIVVCVNHVPDTEARVRVGEDGKTIDRTNVNYILNPYDEFAIEECLRLKEKYGGEVIALSLGGDNFKETLRKALSMGVDKAFLLKDESPRDSFAVARALANTIKELSPDIIFFGKQSIDYDNSQVGTMVAEMLGLPAASVIIKLEISGGTAIVQREIEGGHEVVEVKLPAVFSAQKGLNEPRYPSLKGIMAAKGKPIQERPAPPVESRVEVLSMRNPPGKNPGRIVGTGVSAVPELVRLLHEEAKVI
ncbi:MAG: electron transfer flavoprotein subunit beta/FixA family protein [Bacteroidota bacterium]